MDKNSFQIFFKDIKLIIADTLFPVSCLGCGKENDWICKRCFLKIEKEMDQTCPLCEKMKTPDGRICFSCKKKTSLDGLLVCASYKDKLISKTIHSFKYRFIPDLHKPLGELMVKKILNSSINLPTLIIPVPLHKKRLRWRGFNQSELLAKYISKNITPGFEIPISENSLQRNRYTKSQMEIKNYQKRNENMSGAFSVSNAENLKSKSVFLIDDVTTTGSTIFECAKVLKKNGVREVFGIVIARQEIKEG